MGIISMLLYDKIKSRLLFWILFAIIALLTTTPIFFDWAIIGVTVVLLTHIIRNENTRRVVPSIVAGLFMLAFSLLGIWSETWAANNPYIQVELAGMPGYDSTLMLVSTVFIIGCFAAAFLLRKFNGERGKKMKWLFYSFYPLHLAVLGVVAFLMDWVDLSFIGL
jgi:hypothetical protein